MIFERTGSWLPVCMKVRAGSWLTVSVCSDRIMQSSSTIRAVHGSSSETQRPLCPCRAKRNFDGAIGKRAWPDVMVVSRWPMRTVSGRSLS